MRQSVLSLLRHDRLGIRVLAALGVGYGLLYASWAAGYFLVPEGMLRGWLQTGAGLQADTVPALALKIFAYNLALPGLLIVALSYIQVGTYSMGYNVPFINALMYGLWLGSNSLSIPMPQRLAPTLALFWQRSGPYEMGAFMLTAAAFARVARVRQATFWNGLTSPIPPEERQQPGLAGYLIVAVAVLLLAAANLSEAHLFQERVKLLLP